MVRGKHWDDGWLTAYWNKKERDISFGFPSKPDGHLLHGLFSGYYDRARMREDKVNNFFDELERRGYDITTLQFSVKRKYKPNEKPASEAA
jgi:hypothetical protein